MIIHSNEISNVECIWTAPKELGTDLLQYLCAQDKIMTHMVKYVITLTGLIYEYGLHLWPN